MKPNSEVPGCALGRKILMAAVAFPLAVLGADSERYSSETDPVDTRLAAEEKSSEKHQKNDEKTEKGDPATNLTPILVTDDGIDTESYFVPDTSSATKTDTPVMETPLSIQSVPNVIMEDQQVIRLEDALKNVSSVQGGGESELFQNDFTVRGFNLGADIDSAIYRNGARLTSVNIVPSGLERVEVIKGPAALLYGRIQPGALINVVTKQPSDQPYYALRQQFGSFDMFRTSLDATDSFDNEGKLLYRLNFDHLTKDSFRDFLFQEQTMVRPSLSWDVTEDTRLSVSYEFQSAHFGQDMGIPALGNRPANIPITRNLSDPDFVNQEREDHIAELDLSHRFNPDWEVRWQGVYANEQRDQDTMFPLTLNEQTGDLQRGVFGARLRDHETWSTSLNLTGQMDLFGTLHTLLIGADYYNEVRKSRLLSSIPNFGPIPSIDIFNPQYGGIPRLTAADFASDQALPFRFRNEWYGIYLQDQMVFFDRLHVLLGGRFDDTTATRDDQTIDTRAINPRYGVLYRPFHWLSLYGHYVTALGLPNSGLGVSNGTFAPENSEQFEAGFKTEFFDGQLGATVAFFELTKKNILTPDPHNPGFSVATGKARSRGIEFDVTGQITDELRLIGSYAYLDTEILDDNQGNVGNQLINAPRNSGSLWAQYNLFEPLNIGAGVFAASQRELDLANTAQMPGYVRVDAMVSY